MNSPQPERTALPAQGYADWSEMASSNPELEKILNRSIRHGDVCTIDLSDYVDAELVQDDTTTPAAPSAPKAFKKP